MKKFEYHISVPAQYQSEADEKMKALTTILNKLTAEELKKVAEVVSNPAKLAMIKARLL